jgi:type VI secretion system secreted protein VgrG
MAVFSKISLKIGDKEISDVQSISLQQEMLMHHFLSIKIRRDHLEKEDHSIFKESQNLIGEGIKLVIESDYEDKHEFKLEFIGVVYEIKTIRSNQYYGDIIQINASSPDIQMDDVPGFCSYEEKNLDAIVNEVLERFRIKKKDIASKPNPKIQYTVQFNENAFKFLKRLAIKHGQWFFYDGDTLHFGKIPKKNVKLEYGKDLFQLDFSMKLNSFIYEYVTQDYLLNKKEMVDSDNANRYIPKMAKPAFDKSKKVFQQKSHHFFNGSLNDLPNYTEIYDATNLSKSARISNLMFCGGTSDDPGVSLGATIEITEDIRNGDQKQTLNHGKYIIIGVSHTCDAAGHYQNNFTAVPVDVEVPHYTNPDLYNFAESHSAIVTDNADPNGLGRIRVQHFWQQATNQKTPWLRIVTPYGGKEKGIFFVPEIGEEVLVGFEGGNVERPYVNGSLFHGKEKPDDRWNGKDNDYKTIRSRSGHTIELIDKKGKEEIKIYDGDPDKFNYSITLASHSKEILVEAKGDMEIKADNIRITANNDFEIKANNIKQTASTNFDLKASNKMSLDAGAQMEQKASAKMSVNGGGQLEQKAAIIKIN